MHQNAPGREKIFDKKKKNLTACRKWSFIAKMHISGMNADDVTTPALRGPGIHFRFPLDFCFFFFKEKSSFFFLKKKPELFFRVDFRLPGLDFRTCTFLLVVELSYSIAAVSIVPWDSVLHPSSGIRRKLCD